MKLSSRRKRTKEISLLLSGALLVTLPLGNYHAHASSVSPLKKIIVSENASWMQPALQVDGMTVRADLAGRFPLLSSAAVFTADSSSQDVLQVSVVDGHLKLAVLKEGTATVTVTGNDGVHPAIVDTVQVTIHKRGDITGDGTIDQADSLFIQQVVKGLVTPSAEDMERLDLNGDGKVTSADATAAMSLYLSQKKGTVPNEYHMTLTDVNDAPIAYGIAFAGTAEVGQTVTGSHHYIDAEQDAEAATAVQWYRGTLADGSDREAIAGATSASYTLQMADGGKYLFYGVTPKAATGVPAGTAAISAGTLVPIPDTTAPTILGVTPLDNATGVALDGSLAIAFDEPVAAVAGKYAKIYKSADHTEVASYDVSDAAHVVVTGADVEVKGLSLASLTEYYVAVEAGAFRDLAGNPHAGLSGPTTWSFATKDVVAPTALQFAPVGGDPSAPYVGALTIAFDELVTGVAGKTIAVRLAATDAAVATYDAADAAKVAVSATVSGSRATIANPGLAAGTAYYVEVEAGAFVDAAGNGYAGISGNTGWSFETVDDIAPTVASVAPNANAAGVAANAPLTIAFDEAVTPVSGNSVVLYDASNDSVVGTFDVGDSTVVSLAGKTATIAAPGLSENKMYYVEVPAGAFVDAAGNPFAGLIGKASWSFATVDTIAPTVVSTLPVDDAASASAGMVLAMIFSEKVTAAADKTITVYDAADDSVLKTYQASEMSFVGLTGTLQNPGLAVGKDYYVQMDAGAFEDSAGNPIDAIEDKTTWNFSTSVPLSIDVTLDANNDPVDEITLDGAALYVTATGGTFKEDLSEADFAVNNAPPGTSVFAAGKLLDDQAFLFLTNDGTDFDVDYNGVTITALASAFENGTESATSNTFAVQPVIEPNSLIVSEVFVGSSNDRFAIELYSPVELTGYQIEVYQYVPNPSRIEVSALTAPTINANRTYHIINSLFYDFMDLFDYRMSFIYGYNLEVPSTWADATLNAIVVKKDGQVVDMVGDPTATGPRPIVEMNKTKVRRADVPGGSNVYRPNQWITYSSAQLLEQYGKHTQQ
ncbi:Ig-like domain-containing protein [Paenibacillus antri]|nr:Ig-like domain-containing protein [Paenibacillus antri]